MCWCFYVWNIIWYGVVNNEINFKIWCDILWYGVVRYIFSYGGIWCDYGSIIVRVGCDVIYFMIWCDIFYDMVWYIMWWCAGGCPYSLTGRLVGGAAGTREHLGNVQQGSREVKSVTGSNRRWSDTWTRSGEISTRQHYRTGELLTRHWDNIIEQENYRRVIN